jgi:predicted metal-dependent hydrolase
LPDLRDPELARAVRDFAGQESVHAHEHASSLACLAGLGYRVDGLARWFAWVSRWMLRPLTRYVARPVCGASGSIAIFAGVEHWTATMAEAVLQMRYPRMYGPIVSLYYWHAAEELEHKSVVADVLVHLGSSYPVRILMFLSGTIAFAGLSLVGALAILVQIPALQGRGVIGHLVFPLRVAWDAVVFGLVREKVVWHFARGVVRYLVPFHHPDQRSTDELVARGLELSVATGGGLRPARKADA